MVPVLPGRPLLASALALALLLPAPTRAQNPTRTTFQVRAVSSVSGYDDRSGELFGYATPQGGTLADRSYLYCLDVSGEFEVDGDWSFDTWSLCEISPKLNVPKPADGPLAKVSELRRLADKARRLSGGQVLTCPVQEWDETSSHPGGTFVGTGVGTCRVR